MEKGGLKHFTVGYLIVTGCVFIFFNLFQALEHDIKILVVGEKNGKNTTIFN